MEDDFPNPYQDRPEHAFWRRTVANVPPFLAAPAVGGPFGVLDLHEFIRGSFLLYRNVFGAMSRSTGRQPLPC